MGWPMGFTIMYMKITIGTMKITTTMLVGAIPTSLKNVSLSVGMLIPKIWKNKTSSKPPNSHYWYLNGDVKGQSMVVYVASWIGTMVPKGNHNMIYVDDFPENQHTYWKLPSGNSEFPDEKQWFSIAMLVDHRVYHIISPHKLMIRDLDGNGVSV